MRAPGILALCAATTLTVAPSVYAAEPQPIALLTSVGVGGDADKRDVDTGLRAALLREDTVDLLAPVETRQHVNSMAEMGLICLPEDTACLAKLGILANVALVLVPVVDKGKPGKVTVSISVIDVGGAKRVRAVNSELDPTDEAELTALARRAIGIEPKPTTGDPSPDKGNGGDTKNGGGGDNQNGGGDNKNGGGDVVTPPTTDPAGPSLGIILASVGGAVGGLAIAGAIVCDLAYANVIQIADADTRKNVIQPAGVALWIAGGVGLVVLGSGIALTFSDAPPE